MKRLFIAVKIEAESNLLRIISTLKAILGDESIKWVDPGNIHLTIAFLGDTDEKRIKTLDLMLKDKCSGFGEFEFFLKGSGLFKNFRDPRVIWAGIESNGELAELHTRIKTGLAETGFRIEERLFRPHLTLGRIKSLKNTDNLKTVLEKYRDVEIQKVNVREVILFESILLQTGPLYKPVTKFGLQ